MSITPVDPDFEAAFHHAAERHERIWIFGVLIMLMLLTLATMFTVVTDYGVVTKPTSFQADPTEPMPLAGFHDGQVVQTGPETYAVYMTARLWTWSPSPVHVKQDAAITFYVTSSDVLHGFEIEGTTVNMTAVPGIVGNVTYTFRRPGVFHIICNEFCGLGHQSMIGRIIVDPKGHA